MSAAVALDEMLGPVMGKLPVAFGLRRRMSKSDFASPQGPSSVLPNITAMPPSAISWASARRARPMIAAVAETRRVLFKILCIFVTPVEVGIKEMFRASIASLKILVMRFGHFGFV